MIKKEIISTDYPELEKLIRDTYGIGYEIMPSEEVGSSQYAATYTQIINKGELDQYDGGVLESFKRGNAENHSLHVIMTDMCNKGILEEGEYIIDVNW